MLSILTYILSGNFQYKCEIEVNNPKGIKKANFQIPLKNKIPKRKIKFAVLRPDSSISAIFSKSFRYMFFKLRVKKDFKLQVLVSSSNLLQRTTRVLNCEIRVGNNFGLSYEVLDQSTAAIIIIRSSLIRLFTKSYRRARIFLLTNIRNASCKYWELQSITMEENESNQSMLQDPDLALPLSKMLIYCYSAIKKEVRKI